MNGDYSFGNNQNDFLEGKLAAAQAIKTNLRLLLGEWWEDLEKGLPLFQNILSRAGTPENNQAVDLLIQSTIASTPGVKNISKLASDYDSITRTYTISCTVETIYGEITLEEVIF